VLLLALVHETDRAGKRAPKAAKPTPRHHQKSAAAHRAR
jgi:hypothetical protein